MRIGKRHHDETSSMLCPRCEKKLMARYDMIPDPFAFGKGTAVVRDTWPRALFCRFCPFKIKFTRPHDHRRRA